MQLPDFAQALDFIRLREQMGAISIPTLPEVEFVQVTKEEREVVEIDETDKKLLGTLRSRGVEVSIGDLDVQEGLLAYSGQKVVAYIRDQDVAYISDEPVGINEYAKTSSYRFHLCDCKKMQEMRRAGRGTRYLATQRSDGLFEVNYETGGGCHAQHGHAARTLLLLS